MWYGFNYTQALHKIHKNSRLQKKYYFIINFNTSLALDKASEQIVVIYSA